MLSSQAGYSVQLYCSHLIQCIAALLVYDAIKHNPLLSCPEPGSEVVRSSVFTWLKSPECCRIKCYVLILCLAIHWTAIQTPLVLLFSTLLWLFGPFLHSLFLSTRPLIFAAPSDPSNWTHSHRSVLLSVRLSTFLGELAEQQMYWGVWKWRRRRQNS